jgi:hypothetical protein
MAAAPRFFDGEDAPSRLIWFSELGLGYYPVDQTCAPYDEAYFAKYEKMGDTNMGRALNIARERLVSRHWCGPLVDVGIGCGSFMTHCDNRETWGYDINPAAVRWLHQQDRYWNPRIDPCDAVCLWDVLEHMPDFPDLLANVRKWAFVAVPIFQSVDHVLRSRHFRPDEHCWYFTENALVDVMYELGWCVAEVTWVETALGRDQIASFAFTRR